MTFDIDHPFIYVFTTCMSSLVRYLFKSFAPFKNSINCFHIIEFKSSFVYFGYQALIKYVFCKYFLPVCGLSSHSFDYGAFQSRRNLFSWKLDYRSFFFIESALVSYFSRHSIFPLVFHTSPIFLSYFHLLFQLFFFRDSSTVCESWNTGNKTKLHKGTKAVII